MKKNNCENIVIISFQELKRKGCIPQQIHALYLDFCKDFLMTGKLTEYVNNSRKLQDYFKVEDLGFYEFALTYNRGKT